MDSLIEATDPFAGRDLLRTLAHEHREGLRRFVLRRVGHEEDAKEIVQEAFVAATRSVSGFRGESRPSTWLYAIAAHLACNHLDRAPHRCWRFESDEPLANLPTPPHDDPAEIIGRRRLVLRLVGLIEALPEPAREVVRLVGIEGLSCEEAADRLGVPAGTVRSRLSRARVSLRASLGADGPAAEHLPRY